MADSITQLVNVALSQMGHSRIMSLSDASAQGSKAAAVMTDVYGTIRDSVLRAHNWNCAIVRMSLPLLTTTPAFKYEYEHQLPADFLRLVRVQDVSDDYKIEGQKILSHFSEMKIVYIRRIENVIEMDALLQETLAAKLAAETVLALKGDTSTKDRLENLYRDKLNEARYIDAVEGPLETIEGFTWVNSRLAGSTSLTSETT